MKALWLHLFDIRTLHKFLNVFVRQSPAVFVLIVAFERNFSLQIITKEISRRWFILILNNTVTVFSQKGAQNSAQILGHITPFKDDVDISVFTR